MSRPGFLPLLLTILLCGPPAAPAQGVLTLDSCLVIALANSPALRSADNAVRAAGLARSELLTTVLPQIQAVIDGIYLPVPPRYGYDPAITDGGEVRGLVPSASPSTTRGSGRSNPTSSRSTSTGSGANAGSPHLTSHLR